LKKQPTRFKKGAQDARFCALPKGKACVSLILAYPLNSVRVNTVVSPGFLLRIL
jgi:hypothetical protein